MKNIFFIVIIIFVACQENEKIDWNNSFAASQIQTFEIEVGKEMTLNCKGGSTIIIPADAFQTTNKTFILEVKEALKISEMLAFGLSTVDEYQYLLETNGMIKIEPKNEQEVKLNPNAKISITIPSRYMMTNTFLYIEGKKVGNSFLWQQKEKIDNLSILNEIEKGEKLFQQNCISCHNANLVDKGTGPALANVHRYRNLEWFTNFTKNSQFMINKGDIAAVCLWHTWKPTVMNSFSKFSDADCKAIYNFIQNKSEREKLELKRYDCIILGDTDTSLVQIEGNEIKEYNQNMTKNPLNIAPAFYPLTFSPYNYEWHNCDSPIEEGTYVKIKIDYQKNIFKKYLKNFDYQPNIYLIYKNKNILYNWYNSPEVRILKGKADLISINYYEGKYYYSRQEVNIEDDNSWVLDIKEISESNLENELKSFDR